jgi:hypothetical protein
MSMNLLCASSNYEYISPQNQLYAQSQQGCLFLMCADEIERIMDREGVFIEG